MEYLFRRKKEMRNNRIAILIQGYVLKESPTIYYLSKELTERGFKVDILIERYDHKEDDPYKQIGVDIVKPLNNGFADSARKIFGTVQQCSIFNKNNKNRSNINTWIKDFDMENYISFLRGIDFSRYAFLFVVEPEGLLVYHFLNLKLPFVYLSVELNNLSYEKKSRLQKYKKKIERHYNKKAMFTIIQDKIRERILREDNILPQSHQCINIPVTIPGNINTKRGTYFREKFKISNDKKIVLYAGSIMEWACLREIIKQAHTWDEKFVLIIHGGRYDEKYLIQLKRMAKKNENIYFSTEWVEYDALDEIISSADIGIALYVNNTINNELTQFASAKVAAYLKSGVPVIVNNYGANESFYKENFCGEVISDYTKISDKLRKIDENYEKYRENAFSAFLNYYSFDNNFEKIMKQIKLHTLSNSKQVQVELKKIDQTMIDNIYKKAIKEQKNLIQFIWSYNADNVNVLSRKERAFPGNKEFIRERYYHIMLKRYLFAAAHFCKEKKTLDTCCGLGWGTRIVGEYAQTVTAFDIDEKVVEFCKNTWNKENIEWLRGDALDLSFLNKEYFDVALAMETIEHFSREDGQRYIYEISKALKKDGILIGTSVFPNTTQEAADMCSKNSYHLHVFTYKEMKRLLKKHFSQYKIINQWMFIAQK